MFISLSCGQCLAPLFGNFIWFEFENVKFDCDVGNCTLTIRMSHARGEDMQRMVSELLLGSYNIEVVTKLDGLDCDPESRYVIYALCISFTLLTLNPLVTRTTIPIFRLLDPLD
jgi:hypothetical protein